MKFKKIILYVLPVAIILFIWELVAREGPVNQALFPPPSVVLQSLCGLFLDGTLFSDVKESIWRLFVGLVLGSGGAVTLGLLTGRNRFVNIFVSPLIHVLRPLPAVSIIPLVIVWLGIDNTAKIFTIAFGSFFPIWINTHIGARQIPEIFLWSARFLKITKLKLFLRVILPAALPFILAGIRTGSAIGCAMVFVSELAGASSGVGYRIVVSQSVYRIDQMMAGLVVLGLLGATIDFLIIVLSKRMTSWFRQYKYEPHHN